MLSQSQSLHIDADVSHAWSLTSSFYTSPAVFEEEKDWIFRRNWQVAGHRDQLLHAGDYFTLEPMGEPLLLLRGQSGELRGFYNVCRHRAGPAALRMRVAQTVSLRLSRMDLRPGGKAHQRP